jgi:hypothetical protein
MKKKKRVTRFPFMMGLGCQAKAEHQSLGQVTWSNREPMVDIIQQSVILVSKPSKPTDGFPTILEGSSHNPPQMSSSPTG